METFMMPPGDGVAGMLPPGLGMPPAQMPAPQAGATPQAQLAPQEAQVVQRALTEEGASGGSESGLGFFDKLRTDPKLSQAMMMAGIRMMQGGKPGQNTMGILGDAMMAGAAAHNMLSHNERQQGIEEQKLAMQQAESTARVESTQANTDNTKQRTAFAAELQPMEVTKARELLAKLKTENRSAELRVLADAIRNDPVEVRRIMQEESAARRASAASGFASAANSGASAAGKKQEVEWAKTIADPKATAEQVAAAQRGLDAGRIRTGVSSAAVQNRADLLAYYRAIYPDMPEADLRKKVLEQEQTAKAKPDTQAFSDFVSKTGIDITTPEGYQQAVELYQQMGADFGAKKQGAAKPAGKVASEADILATMQATGKSRAEVIQAVKAKGYTLEGEK